MRPSAISPCHFDHISVSLLVPFRWSDIPPTRLLDSKRVNPGSKGLTRFNPESTRGLNVVNPESTPALTASTPGLAGQPRASQPKTRKAATRNLRLRRPHKYYSKEKANCQAKNAAKDGNEAT